MPLPALIILIVTIVVFGIGIILVFINKGKLVLPEGTVISVKDNEYIAHVIFGNEITLDDNSYRTAVACAKAASALNISFRSISREPAKSIREIAVLFLTDSNFHYSYYGEAFDSFASAYLGQCKKSFEESIPMPVIRSKFIERVRETGEPVIHELCHALLGEVHALEAKHEEVDIWADFGDNTVQARARELFKDLL